MDSGILKCIIAGCATAVTLFKIWKDGDGIAITALFTLYGVLLGHEIVLQQTKAVAEVLIPQ